MNRTIKIMLLLFVALWAVQGVHGIGIAPLNHYFPYEEGTDKYFTLRIINNEGKEMRVALDAEGELGEYLQLPKEAIVLHPNEDVVTVPIILSIPSGLGPGKHSAMIIARELPPLSGQEGQVNAVLALVSSVVVEAPREGKHLDAQLNLEEQGDATLFHFNIYNNGKEVVDNIFINVTLLDPSGNAMGTLTGGPFLVNPLEERTVTLRWQHGSLAGTFAAHASIDYGQRIVFFAPLSLGKERIRMRNLAISDYHLGDIARMDLVVENQWNEPIDALLNVTLTGENGTTYRMFTSPPEKLTPYTPATLRTYLDTRDMVPGVYFLNVSLHYGQESTAETFTLQMDEDSIGIVIGAKPDERLRLSWIPFIAGGIIALFLLYFMAKLFLKKKELRR